MKIAIINSVYKVGSTGRICSDFVNFCKNADKEIQVKVFFGRGREKSDDYAMCFNSAPKVFLDVAKSRLFDNAGFNSRSASKKLIAELKRFKPDVLFVHNMHGYYLNLPIFLDYISESKIRSFFVLHDCWLFTGHCCYFDYPPCDEWATQSCRHCRRISSYPKAFLPGASKRNFLKKQRLFNALEGITFVAPSLWLTDNFQKSHLSNFECRCIHNGVDTSVFKKNKNPFREKNGLQNSKIMLGIANIWDERKGLSDFLRLSKLLKQDEFVLIVGRVRNRVNNPHFIYIERTDSVRDLVDIYSSCDVLLNFSYEDNYPTTIIEALSTELRVITFDTGGCGEMVDPRFVVRKGDIESALSIFRNKELMADFVFPPKEEIDKNAAFSRYLQMFRGE